MAKSSLLALLLLSSCAEIYTVYFPDVNLEPPVNLEDRLDAFRSGAELWHGDPRMVADTAIRNHLDVPWKGSPFQGRKYTVKTSPEWGHYVVRGYVYPSGAVTRYRVRIQPYAEIWYVTQVSHFKDVEIPDERDFHRH